MVPSLWRFIVKNQNGFISIVELLIGLALLGVIIGGGYTLLGLGYQIDSSVQERTDLQKQAQTVLNQMADDIRTAKEIKDAETDRVAFIDALNNAKCYYLQGNQLMMALNNSYTGGSIQMNGISSLSFSYEKDSGVLASSAAEAKTVLIALTAQSLKDSKITISLNGEAKLRNFGVDTVSLPKVTFTFESYPLDGETPPNRAVIGGPNSQYNSYLSGGIPVVLTASDAEEIIGVKYYVAGLILSDGNYTPSPPQTSVSPPTYYWYPLQMNGSSRVWPDGTYKFKVEATSEDGFVGSSYVYWTIDNDPPAWDDTQPADLTAMANDATGILLSWQAARDGIDQVDHYSVYRKDLTMQEADFTTIQDDTYTPSLNYNDSNVVAWHTYSYYIKAVSPGGRLSVLPSNTVTVTMPFSITATSYIESSKYKVDITWNAPPSGINVEYYKLFRNGVQVTTIPSPIPASAIKCTDDNGGLGLQSGSTYEYKLQAYNSQNNLVGESFTLSITI